MFGPVEFAVKDDSQYIHVVFWSDNYIIYIDLNLWVIFAIKNTYLCFCLIDF